MRPGFLLAASSGPNYYPDGRRDRRKRRNRQPLGVAALGQPERKKVLSIIVSSDVVTVPERFQLLFPGHSCCVRCAPDVNAAVAAA